MAISFSRSIRSLQYDNNSISLAGLLAAILLAVIWGHWFFTATIVSYETSHEVYVTAQEDAISQFVQEGGASRIQTTWRRIIIAKFPSAAMTRIQPEQLAWLRLDSQAGKQQGPIPAEVIQVINSPGATTGTVILRTKIKANQPHFFEQGQGGEITIEVENTTPAGLVLQASGLLVETPPLSVSPQPH